jgi:hypothetical protein
MSLDESSMLDSIVSLVGVFIGAATIVPRVAQKIYIGILWLVQAYR